ncbi:L-cystine import ATP-binding protein TcyN [compost metagenome]
MRKRAGLARALALDPEVLFFDEPSAGLDPLSSMALDELILQLRDSLGASIVLVTHELPSIYRVADTCLFLDSQTHTQIALGSLQQLLDEGPPTVQRFLRRGEKSPSPEKT